MMKSCARYVFSLLCMAATAGVSLCAGERSDSSATDVILPLQDAVKASQDERGFYVGLGGGPGLMTASYQDDVEVLTSLGMDEGDAQAFCSNLAWGYHLNAEAGHQAGPHFLTAVRYSFFCSQSAVTTVMDMGNPSQNYYVELAERTYVNYLSISLAARFKPESSRIRIHTGLSAGIAFYRDESEAFGYAMLVTSRAFAWEPRLGIEFPLTDRFSIMVNGSWLISRLKKIRLDDGQTSEKMELDKEEYESISRLDLSIDLHFRL
jgi:hypothetical protein